MWNRNKTLCALMLAATLGAGSAAAQTMPRSQTVQQVAISVVDPASGREVDLIERGEDLELALGQEVRLELVDPTVALAGSGTSPARSRSSGPTPASS
jgi:hypothetical protein